MIDLKMSKLDLDCEMETAENFRQKAEETLQSLQENTNSYMRREGLMQGLSLALEVFDAGELARITLCFLISMSVKEEKYMAVLAHFPYSGFDLDLGIQGKWPSNFFLEFDLDLGTLGRLI